MAQPAASPQPLRPIDRKYVGSSPISDYEISQKLGEGTFGEVYKARSRKLGGRIVALKKILMHNEKDGFPITALREIKLLKMLAHKNIIRLEEMGVERVKEKKRAMLYMVMLYMEHDLSGLLDNRDVNFTVPIIKCYMIQLLKGLRYLHESNILHRDMKAANLLISNEGILKIADFGLARHYDEPVPQKGRGNGEAQRDYTTLVVTRWYRPPELLLQLRRYTPAIDMWGAGCVFGEMFKRKPILSGKSDVNQAEIIFELVGSPNETNMPGWKDLPGCEGVRQWDKRPGNIRQVFRELSEDALSLLTSLLTLNWRTRINALDALDHPYFRTPPLPAQPHEIPRFADSHELDRRNGRGAHQELPPAPPGGTVGGGPNDWAAAPDGWGPPPRGHAGGRYPGNAPNGGGRSRVPQGAYGGYDGGRNARGPGPHGGHHLPAPPDGMRHALPQRPDGLPPRPGAPNMPMPMQQAPRIRGGAGRDGGGGGRNKDVDTYIPSYGGGGGGGDGGRPPRRDERRSEERGARLDYDDVRPNGGQRRTRSRSPERARERDRERERRDRDRDVRDDKRDRSEFRAREIDRSSIGFEYADDGPSTPIGETNHMGKDYGTFSGAYTPRSLPVAEASGHGNVNDDMRDTQQAMEGLQLGITANATLAFALALNTNGEEAGGSTGLLQSEYPQAGGGSSIAPIDGEDEGSLERGSLVRIEENGHVRWERRNHRRTAPRLRDRGGRGRGRGGLRGGAEEACEELESKRRCKSREQTFKRVERWRREVWIATTKRRKKEKRKRRHRHAHVSARKGVSSGLATRDFEYVNSEVGDANASEAASMSTGDPPESSSPSSEESEYIKKSADIIANENERVKRQRRNASMRTLLRTVARRIVEAPESTVGSAQETVQRCTGDAAGKHDDDKMAGVILTRMHRDPVTAQDGEGGIHLPVGGSAARDERDRERGLFGFGERCWDCEE